jgi:hypothetical protein
VPSMGPPDLRTGGSPAMPSFASLRSPVRRSPVDLLLPTEPAVGEPATTPPPPRPPEWADLLHLALYLARWSLELPARGVRRVLGS